MVGNGEAQIQYSVVGNRCSRANLAESGDLSAPRETKQRHLTAERAEIAEKKQ